MELVNHTDYLVERAFNYSRDGAELLVIAIKATFDIGSQGLTLSEQQRPLAMADEYFGDPATTSIRASCDLLPMKNCTDLVITGDIQAINTRTRQQEVSIGLGSLQQKLLVSGERQGYDRLSKPEVFDTIPMCWENAYGGTDTSAEDPGDHDYCPENPVGKGFMAKRSRLHQNQTPLPNIELREALLKSVKHRPLPLATNPVPPHWRGRSQFAGTYDDRWRKQRSPLVPEDFDERYFQVSHPKFVAAGYLRGDEQGAVQGMNREGDLLFRLQTPPPSIRVRLTNKGTRAQAAMETLHIFSDDRQLSITWKAQINVHGRVEQLRRIEVEG